METDMATNMATKYLEAVIEGRYASSEYLKGFLPENTPKCPG